MSPSSFGRHVQSFLKEESIDVTEVRVASHANATFRPTAESWYPSILDTEIFWSETGFAEIFQGFGRNF